MDISKVFSLITPLMIVALMGIIIILYGFVDMKQENNVLQFIFGIPIAAGAVGLHFLVRRLAQHNTLHVWIIESILVALMWYVFNRS
ncbi:hypothetical protein GO755_18695 [Spirosoma sp. HMF4905]|uniref:Uncharacterized protein n=1 Tax=Spirosoma arboris TaxID=2682092 RepID=A0A7K1SE54_9BACT|nr:hypothetical protein [Spirosoma arboris]MVM32085.1 hypothetical protein [Spirosoma arboris]